MPKIVPLTPEVIAKIAAGEVIERPMYAVKELVENSLDAQADTIIVELVGSGLRSMRVIDNGYGMDKKDLLLSFQSHTTSKVSQLADLTNVSTMGFRGEALASIAAVSTVTIRSRTKESTTGWEIELREGKMIVQKPCGMPTGTEIVVEHLFGNMPARKKFLTSERKEYQLILDTLLLFALNHPTVHFALIHNGKSILDIPKTHDLAARIHLLLGNDVFTHLIPVNFTDTYFSLQGFIVTPQITTNSAHKQYVAVNNRGITDKGLSTTLKNAYGTLLEKGHHPVAVLSFHLPPEMVDVNVHPRKEEIRFLQPLVMYDFFKRAIEQSLTQHGLALTPVWQSAEKSITQSVAGQLLKSKELSWELPQEKINNDAHVQQIDKLYLLTPTRSGFMLFDQHAAHERILYEQFLATFIDETKKQSSKPLKKPFLWELGISDMQVVADKLAVFSQLGFAMEPFGPKSFVLESVPELFIDRDYKVLLTELLEMIKEEKKPTLDTLSAKMIAYLACRGAVKAGDTLTEKQMQELVSQLQKTPHNMTCPHGRPTHIRFDKQTLAAMFKR